jgi:hypothetical protein
VRLELGPRRGDLAPLPAARVDREAVDYHRHALTIRSSASTASAPTAWDGAERGASCATRNLPLPHPAATDRAPPAAVRRCPPKRRRELARFSPLQRGPRRLSRQPPRRLRRLTFAVLALSARAAGIAGAPAMRARVRARAAAPRRRFSVVSAGSHGGAQVKRRARPPVWLDPPR